MVGSLAQFGYTADGCYNQYQSSQIQMEQAQRTIRGSHCHYTLAELIGEGQFGKVYKGRIATKNEPVAIKAIRRNKFLRNDKLKSLLQREMEVLSEFKHPHVIELIELVVDKQDVYLVYEYCEGGTLQDRITMSEEQFLPLFGQIVDALCRAESKGIIHRDIKPANILFKQGKIKVADWGFSRLLQFGETTCSFIGSPAYMAPQVLKGEEYSQKADVWSLGVVAYESLVGICPWSSKSINSLSNEISKKPLAFPQNVPISKKTQKILSKMLNVDPQLRPSFNQIQTIINVTALTSPKLSRSEGLLSAKVKRESDEQRKIVSCVFFLELIQWSRKTLESNSSLLIFVRLIQQNLLKLKHHLRRDSEIREVWEKELKVISEMKRKLKQKIALKSKYEALYMCKTEVDQKAEESEGDLNPEGQWEGLVKQSIKLAIEELECAYKEGREKKKEQTLIEINVLLDMVLYRQQQENYLKVPFSTYSRELTASSTKSLLRLINSKLMKINSIYY